jgi:hypothetical protein
MNETTGTISLDTLKRSVHWVDRYGNQHALTDMTQDYLQNTLAHLRRMGSALYSLELKRRDREVLLAEMTGWENGPTCPWRPAVRLQPRCRAGSKLTGSFTRMRSALEATRVQSFGLQNDLPSNMRR